MKRKKSVSEDGLKIGPKIKALREKRRLTPLDLAAKTGLEKAVLAEMESGELIPPVASLLRISRALGAGMADFFEDETPGVRVSLTRNHERAQVKSRPHHHIGEVDYSYESLETKIHGKHMDPFLVEFRFMETSELVCTSHEGEEFVYVLEGRLEFRSDERVETLGPGDSIYFQSELNHSFRSLEKKPARAVVVVWSTK
jgi:transcriptional regulator with XRE-family HTH domain